VNGAILPFALALTAGSEVYFDERLPIPLSRAYEIVNFCFGLSLLKTSKGLNLFIGFPKKFCKAKVFWEEERILRCAQNDKADEECTI